MPARARLALPEHLADLGHAQLGPTPEARETQSRWLGHRAKRTHESFEAGQRPRDWCVFDHRLSASVPGKAGMHIKIYACPHIIKAPTDGRREARTARGSRARLPREAPARGS